MPKAKYDWINLPNREPRGSSTNLERIRLLVSSVGARIKGGKWQVRVKKGVPK